MKPKNTKDTSKKDIDKMVSLAKSGKNNKEIADITGYKYNTVKTILRRTMGVRIPKLTSEQYKQIKLDMAVCRTTMSIDQVATKFNRTERYVRLATMGSELSSKFLRKRYKGSGPAGIRTNTTQKKVVRNAETIQIDQSHMQKGHTKLKKNEKVFQNKIYDSKLQRAVPLLDGKNTTVFVNQSDTRTNDEIRDYFRNKDNKFFESCKDASMIKAKEKSDRKRAREERRLSNEVN